MHDREKNLFDSYAARRISRTSRVSFGPYLLSGGTPVYTVMAYDQLGRVITSTAPDGGITTSAYHGLSTTVTVRLR